MAFTSSRIAVDEMEQEPDASLDLSGGALEAGSSQDTRALSRRLVRVRPNCVHQIAVTEYRPMSPTLTKYALTRCFAETALVIVSSRLGCKRSALPLS